VDKMSAEFWAGVIGRGSRKGTNRLNAGAIKSFLAGNAPTKKLFDGGGLYLTRTPAGSPVWRLKYRFADCERTYALGVYPAVSLQAARSGRDEVRAHLNAGRDPQQARLLAKADSVASSGSTYRVVVTEWLAKERKCWSPRHYAQTKCDIERDVLPLLGNLPVDQITPAMIAKLIDKVVARGAEETASKILWNIERVFRLAQARGLRSDNPATPVREVLPRQRPNVPRPALLDFPSLREVLARSESAPISPAVRICHKLIAYTGARIGNAIAADWKEFNLDSDTPTWTVPRAKMKVRERKHDHKMLLGPTIAADLRMWRTVSRGRGFVFPGPTGRSHITHEALEKSYRVTLGLRGKHSVHGWRSSLSTLARDAGFARDVVELTLDHLHDNEVVRAYDRGERLEERKRLMAWWDAELSSAEHGAKVLPLRPAGVA